MKMLFLCSTEFQLLTALNIRYHMYPNDAADIIVNNFHGEEKALANRIRQTQLFDNVVYVRTNIETQNFHRYFKNYLEGEKTIKLSYALVNTLAFLKIKVLSWLFGDYFYVKRMICGFEKLKLDDYNAFFVYPHGRRTIMMSMINYLHTINKNCRINLLDEGVGSYVEKGEYTNIIDNCYVYEPSLSIYKSKFCKVPRIKKEDRGFIEILNEIFQFQDSDIEDYHNSIIFFDQSVYSKMPKYLQRNSFIFKTIFYNAYKRHLKEERDFYNQIRVIDFVLNSDTSRKVWVKLHPRPSKDAIEEYRKKDVSLIRRYDLPWELIALNCPMENIVLVANSSSSVCLFKGIMDDDRNDIQCILLNILSKEELTNTMTQYFKKLEKIYNNFYIPKTVNELMLILQN